MDNATLKILMEQKWEQGEIACPNNITRWEVLTSGTLWGTKGRNNFATAKRTNGKRRRAAKETSNGPNST